MGPAAVDETAAGGMPKTMWSCSSAMSKHEAPEHFKPYAGSLPCAHAPLAGELVLYDGPSSSIDQQSPALPHRWRNETESDRQ